MTGIDEKVLARRQRDLERFTESMADALNAAAGDFSRELLPTWKRMEARIAKKLKALYDELGATQDPKQIRTLLTQTARLEAFYSNIIQDIRTAEAQYQPAYTAHMYNIFEKTYYMTGYGLEQAARVAVQVPIISTKQILGVLANPWLSDGMNYSARIRANTLFLAQKMREVVESAISEGWNWNTAAHAVSKAANEGYFNAVRLVRTEMTRVASLGASYMYMENADILDNKRWNATLDMKTAPRDAANDGKIYDLDYDTPGNPGIPGQRIPNHPYCRCVWTPVLSALGVNQGERFSRRGDSTKDWGESEYTKARDYEEYAKLRGLPSLMERLETDNPKKYLRPGETVESMSGKVKRWNYQGNSITVPKPLWSLTESE